MSAPVKLRLTLDVTYDPADTPVHELTDMLGGICSIAAADGLMSRYTTATVAQWSYKVEVVPLDEKPHALSTTAHREDAHFADGW